MCGPISNQLFVPRVQFEYDQRQCLHFWQTVGIKMSVPLNYPPITSLTPQYYLLCHCLLSSRDSFIMVKKNWFYMYRNTISTYMALANHPSSARIQRFLPIILLLQWKDWCWPMTWQSNMVGWWDLDGEVDDTQGRWWVSLCGWSHCPF